MGVARYLFCARFIVSMAVVGLLAELHSACLGALEPLGSPVAGGLTAAARMARRQGRIKPSTARRLERLDVAWAWARHVTVARAAQMVTLLRDELGEPSSPSSPVAFEIVEDDPEGEVRGDNDDGDVAEPPAAAPDVVIVEHDPVGELEPVPVVLSRGPFRGAFPPPLLVPARVARIPQAATGESVPWTPQRAASPGARAFWNRMRALSPAVVRQVQLQLAADAIASPAASAAAVAFGLNVPDVAPDAADLHNDAFIDRPDG